MPRCGVTVIAKGFQSVTIPLPARHRRAIKWLQAGTRATIQASERDAQARRRRCADREIYTRVGERTSTWRSNETRLIILSFPFSLGQLVATYYSFPLATLFARLQESQEFFTKNFSIDRTFSCSSFFSFSFSFFFLFFWGGGGWVTVGWMGERIDRTIVRSALFIQVALTFSSSS